MKRCPECFHEYDDSFSVCPDCGTPDNIQPAEPVYLAPGTVLQNRYFIGRSTGAGGFGIVYKAWDMKLETVVAVKEFFVGKLVTRAAGLKEVIVSNKSYSEFSYRKDRFLAEARTMAKFGKHRSIPNVFEFFEENNTAYIVMEFLGGVALNDYLKQQNGIISPDFAVMIATEVGNALKSLHDEKIIHRDVAPDNIFICSGKEIKIKLMDFGAARLEDETDNVVDIILKPGYSPPEQYDSSQTIGPWTDIYALGATLYNMITGIKPDESTNRKIKDTVLQPSEIVKGISENLNNTIMKAMAAERHMRFRSVSEFLQALGGTRKVRTLSLEKRIRNTRRILSIAAAFAVIAASAFAGAGILSRKMKEQQLQPAEIELWFCAENNSDEITAMQSVADNFTSVFPEVTVNLKSFPPDTYFTELDNAAQADSLPVLFESTGTSQVVLDKTSDLSNVISSDQFRSCMFLIPEKCTHQIPLGIEVPVTCVITNGAEHTDYEGCYYSDISDFNYNNIVLDESCSELYSGLSYDFRSDISAFMDNTKNTSAVMLSSTMMMNRIRNELTNYEKLYVFPDTDSIPCRYTYQWSMCSSADNPDETAAAETLLSWMLGNVYQTTLMISECSDGQIPVNTECFRTKTENRILSPVADIYKKFSFESEEQK